MSSCGSNKEQEERSSVGAAGSAGQSLADELREADPGIKLHHVDSNDRIAVINIVYSDPNDEGKDDSVYPAGNNILFTLLSSAIAGEVVLYVIFLCACLVCGIHAQM